MKKLNTTVASIVIAFTFACVLSCSEQDEKPIGQSLALNSAGSDQIKARSKAGRTGGLVFNSSVGDPIDRETSSLWVANYREQNPDNIRSHFFGSEIIQQILNEEGSVGIRIYYALDEKGDKKLLIVGVDGEGRNLLPGAEEALDSGGYIIGDYSFPCPDYCPDIEL